MERIHGFFLNTIADMRNGRESWRIFAITGLLSLTVSIAAGLVR